MLNYLITRIAASTPQIISPSDINIPKGTPDSVLPTILHIVFAVAGGISVLIVTIAGLRLILSIGNPEGLNRARNALIYAALGLVICIAGYTIVSFVVNRIQ